MTGGAGKQWINGETIAGIALVFLALLFIWGATMNTVWARILLADYVHTGNWSGLHRTGHNNHAQDKPYAFRGRRTYPSILVCAHVMFKN